MTVDTPSALFDALHTLIAPGNRVRVSPYVESIQFRMLFGEPPNLYGQPFPVLSIDLLGVDSNPGVLAFARQVALELAAALDERQADRPDGLDLAVAARESRWEVCDLNLNYQLPDLAPTPKLLVAANVLSERSLSDTGRENLAQAVAALVPGSLAVVIEPGACEPTKRLNGWRRDLVRRYPGVTPLMPCGGELGRDQSDVCGQCWNARREHLHPTSLYQRFREEAAKCGDNRKPSDPFDNDLLSWSYTVLLRGESPPAEPQPGVRLIGKSVQGILRYVGVFRQTEANATPEPLAEGPDRPSAATVRDYIKFCPATLPESGLHGLAFCRPVGFRVEPLSHGDLVNCRGLELTVIKNWGRLSLPQEDRENEGDLGPLRVARRGDGFLVNYGATARAAVDEIAFRLFGFQGMRPFQHDILGIVLTGQNILGIAATGGGKSECYILPAMLLPGVTVVVSPLKSLMQDQYDQRISERYGLQHLATFVNGDVPFRERESRLKRMELGYYKLVYFTPEQLERGYVLDSLKRTHDGVGVRFLALDEAHCISQWGHDFRPSYLNLWHRLKEHGITPVRIALTATASPDVRRDLLEELQLTEGDLYLNFRKVN